VRSNPIFLVLHCHNIIQPCSFATWLCEGRYAISGTQVLQIMLIYWDNFIYYHNICYTCVGYGVRSGLVFYNVKFVFEKCMWIVNVISNFAGARVQLSLTVLLNAWFVGVGGSSWERWGGRAVMRTFPFYFSFLLCVYMCVRSLYRSSCVCARPASQAACVCVHGRSCV